MSQTILICQPTCDRSDRKKMAHRGFVKQIQKAIHTDAEARNKSAAP
jgi:hypothetical protein